MSALERLRSVKQQANKDMDAKALYQWYVADRVSAGWSPDDVEEYREAVREEMKTEEGKAKAITFWSEKYAQR